MGKEDKTTMPEEDQMQAPELNENQAAFFDFLKTHYNKEGGEGALKDLLEEMEGEKEAGGSQIPEAAHRILEDAQKKGGVETEMPIAVQGESIMCIKSWDVDGKKLFFNLGQSSKIDEPELVMKDGEEQTRLPMSLGPPFEDVDAKGEPCLLFDVLFNPLTMADAVNFQFLSFIVQMIMIRIEEKHSELPALNKERKFKKLKQKVFKGRTIPDQLLKPQPLLRGVHEESGLRDFSGPELAEPSYTVSNPKRRTDGSQVTRLRVELPDVEADEIQVRIAKESVELLVPAKYRIDIALEVNVGYTLLSSKFHRDNHTLTLVWGPQHAKEYDEEQHAEYLEECKKAEEDQRLKLTNNIAFELVCDDY